MLATETVFSDNSALNFMQGEPPNMDGLIFVLVEKGDLGRVDSQ